MGQLNSMPHYAMYEAIWWGNCFLSKCSVLIGGSFVLSNLIFWRLPTCLSDQKSHTTKTCYLWFFKKINCDVLTMDLSDHEEHKSKAPFEKILEKSMIIEANWDLRGGQMAITFDLSEIILKRIPIRIHKSHENIILNPLFLREFFSHNIFSGDKIFSWKRLKRETKLLCFV